MKDFFALSKEKPLGDLVRTLLIMSVNFVETRFISRIPTEDVRVGLLLLLNPIRQMILALNDDDPRNDEQIRELWLKFTNTDLANFSDEVLQKNIARIEEEDLRIVVAFVATNAIKILRLVTDEEKDNTAQLQAFWNEFVKDPNTHQVVLEHIMEPVLSGVIKDEDTVQFILDLIATALKSGTTLIEKKIAERIALKLSPQLA